jgi:hypothetical protein
MLCLFIFFINLTGGNGKEKKANENSEGESIFGGGRPKFSHFHFSTNGP